MADKQLTAALKAFRATTGMAGGADVIAAYLAAQPTSWTACEDLVRDSCDGFTGGELDYFQLNLLTDLVLIRLAKAGKFVDRSHTAN